MPTTTRPARALPCALVAVLTAVLAALVTVPAVAAATAPKPLLVVGFAGVTWDDAAAMPALRGVAGRGGTADLVVRTVKDSTCAADGWATLGAGARAATGCPAVAAPDAKGAVPGWTTFRRTTRDSLSGAHLGSLGPALAARKGCVAPVGPGAALALADAKGQVSGYAPFAPAAVTAGLARCGVVVADLGGVRAGAARAAELKALDARLARALAAAKGADVVVASLADDAAGARLRPLVVQADCFDGRALTSPSTRQPGLVLLTDLAPTITHLRGLPADPAWSGRAVTAGGAADLATLRDTDLLARTLPGVVGPFVGGVVALALALLAALASAARAGVLGRGRARLAAGALLTLVASVPAATFLARLVPWWRAASPTLAVTAVTLAVAAAVTALAWAGPWRRHPFGPAAVVSAVTAVVIMGDVATGSRLTIGSMLGENPLVAGRFYGLGNVSSGVLAAATLLLMAAVIEVGLERDRNRPAAVVALLLGLGIIALVATPSLGADFGGPAALLPAVLYLGLRGLGLRLDLGRVAALGVVTAGLLAVVCALDWLRPNDQRTHLGRFAETVINGGGGDVVGRKLIQNWTILTASPWNLAVPVVTLALAYVVWRPSRLPRKPLHPVFSRVPLLRLGLLAIFLMLFVAMLTNDSGVTVPAPVGLLVLPLAIGIAVSALD